MIRSLTKSELKKSIPLLLILIFGFLIRLIELEGRPFWYDEAFAVLISRKGPGAIIHGTLATVKGAASDVHPPLYYSILWVWMLIFGESVLTVRLLSVSLSMLCLFCVWRIADHNFNRRTGLIVAALYAGSPFQVHYGQEARMYILLSLLLMLATWSLLRGLQKGGWGPWVVLGVSSAMAMYTHILAVIFLGVLFAAALILGHRDHLGKVISAAAISLVLYSPWLLQVPGQVGKVQSGYWIESPGIVELIQTFMAFNAGLPILGSLLSIALVLSIFAGAVLVWRSSNILRSDTNNAARIMLTVSLAVIPIVILFIISQIWPVYIVRGLLPSGVLYLIWVAWLLGNSHFKMIERYLLASVLAVLFALGLYSHIFYRGFPYAPYQQLNEYLKSMQPEAEIILHSNKISMLPAYYYDSGLPHKFLGDPPGSASDTLARPTQEVIGLLALPDIEAAVAGHDHIFFVVFEREIEDFLQAGVEIHPALEFLSENYQEVEIVQFGELLLYEFKAPGSLFSSFPTGVSLATLGP